MSADAVLDALFCELQNTTVYTLWYADENTLPMVSRLTPNPKLIAITNRYDIYQGLQQRQIHTVFTDFDSDQYPKIHRVEKIIYRISKEKALVHYLINQSNWLLNCAGELFIIGNKNDGIKTYGKKINQQLAGEGQLKKHGNHYVGRYTHLDPSKHLDDEDYQQLRKITVQSPSLDYFYSKPGVFGWNKIDQGTQLLLNTLPKLLNGMATQPLSVLDLGCGYGWIFLNLSQYAINNIVATDNNAAALACAKKNTQLTTLPVTLVASDCADCINEKFDLILSNPPFHQGHQHDTGLTLKFIQQAAARLHQQGSAVFVVNDFIGLQKIAKPYFSSLSIIAATGGFQVHLLSNKSVINQ